MIEPTDAFAPPDDPAPPQLALLGVLAAWAMAGATAGTAVGATLSLTGTVPSVVPVGLAGSAVVACGGAAAWEWERRRSAARPAVVDGHGRHRRPVGMWLLGVPLALGVAGLLALVVVGTVHTESVAVGGAFLAVALGFGTLFRPLWVARLLTRAAMDAERGDLDGARARWTRVARAWVATRSGRAQAALNLGWLSLQRGDLDDAAQWYASVATGRAAAFAAAGEALVRLLQGDHHAAERLLARAMAGGRAVQSEVDGIRMLLVLRRDGPADARELGERLLGMEPSVLFLGVLAAARRAGGDPDAAEALLRDGLAQALRQSPVARQVPEIEALIE